MPTLESIPAFVRELYDRAGPIIRYRIERDVLGRDLSHIAVAQTAKVVAALPAARTLIEAQQPNGLWKDFLTTFFSCLRLCEFGLEEHDAVARCRDEILLPTLLREDVIWEWETFARHDADRRAARQVVRDMTLHMLCRSRREENPLLKAHLERVMAEWSGTETVPTVYGWNAVALYPWTDDDYERVRNAILTLDRRMEETQPFPPQGTPEVLATAALRFPDKQALLGQPWLLLHDLEMNARLGIVRDRPAARWMFEEMEIRQDGDGFFRFDSPPLDPPLYFFPIEETDPARYEIEYTFHAHHIYKLLEYDF